MEHLCEFVVVRPLVSPQSMRKATAFAISRTHLPSTPSGLPSATYHYAQQALPHQAFVPPRVPTPSSSGTHKRGVWLGIPNVGLRKLLIFSFVDEK